VADLLRGKGPEIRYVHIEEKRTIGEKRNFGCLNARGGIIAHWDDDDYSDAKRLADHIERLQGSGKSVTAYSSMLFTDGKQWWKCQRSGRRPTGIGTSLCYRKDYWREHQFEAKQVGEDEAFMMAANSAGQLETSDAGLLMVASIHEGNTSPRMISGDMWSQVERPEGLIYP
jgi:O-antigen biosynthesis protein